MIGWWIRRVSAKLLFVTIADYNYGQYQYDMGTLIASITENGEQVDFLGRVSVMYV